MSFEHEIEKNKQTKKEIEVSLEAAKYVFAQQIANGLGDKIKSTLKNPPQPTKKELRKSKWKKILNKLFDTL